MKRNIFIHPFLFGISPVLFLYSRNINELLIKDVVPSFIVVLVTISLLWVTIVLFIKDLEKTGIIVSFFSLFFFSFGSINDFFYSLNLFRFVSDQALYVLFLWGVVLALVIYSATKAKQQLHRLTVSMNLFAILFILIPTGTAISSISLNETKFRKEPVNGIAPEKCPDIYYIILDGYARSDVLKEVYRYDNSSFLEFLSRKGFYIADKSVANYAQTPLSLASSLNFDFLDAPLRTLDRTSKDSRILIKMIHNNNVGSFLKKHGYEIVAFSTGYAPTDLRESDIYLSPKWSLSEFENILIGFTPLPLIVERISNRTLNDIYRNNISFIFQNLAHLAKKESPKFVFAHITCPHEPFVYGQNGEHIPPDKRFVFSVSLILDEENRKDYLSRFRDQTIFTENRIKEVINSILSTSGTQPIIIIQSDHGPHALLDWFNPDTSGIKERMSILNAYYLPGKKQDIIYNDISPVNSFRVVFNNYFGLNLQLLDDKSYFSTPMYPYIFKDVTDKI